jgi:hypothetical protein
MPYVHDKGYVLSRGQEGLMQSMMQSCITVKQSIIEKWGNEHFVWNIPVLERHPIFWDGWFNLLVSLKMVQSTSQKKNLRSYIDLVMESFVKSCVPPTEARG